METDDTRQIATPASDCPDSSPRRYSLSGGAPQPLTQADREALLLFVDIEDACKIKWDWGAAEHRDEGEQEFQGNPLVELHSEGIDVLNYLQVLMDRGGYDHECLEKMRDSALSIVRGARLLAQNGS